MDTDDILLVLGVLLTALAVGEMAGLWWAVLIIGLCCLFAGGWRALT